MYFKVESFLEDLKNGKITEDDYKKCLPWVKRDDRVILAVVAKNVNALKNASKDSKKDKNFMLKCIVRNPKAINFADESLLIDEDIAVATLSKNPEYAKIITTETKDIKELALKSLDNDGKNYWNLSKELQSDVDIIKHVISHLRYKRDHYFSDRDGRFDDTAQELNDILKEISKHVVLFKLYDFNIAQLIANAGVRIEVEDQTYLQYTLHLQNNVSNIIKEKYVKSPEDLKKFLQDYKQSQIESLQQYRGEMRFYDEEKKVIKNLEKIRDIYTTVVAECKKELEQEQERKRLEEEKRMAEEKKYQETIEQRKKEEQERLEEQKRIAQYEIEKADEIKMQQDKDIDNLQNFDFEQNTEINID